MHKLWRNPLHCHVALILALKFVLLALLWWLCVRDYRSDPGSAQMREALLPATSPVVDIRKETPP